MRVARILCFAAALATAGAAVAQNLVVGVNDKTNRAALGGRYDSQFLEQKWDPSYFSLRTITHMTD